MKDRTDLGATTLRKIFEIWQVDDDRAVWHENGFDWWPGHFKQSVRAFEYEGDDGTTAYRLQATTDFLCEAPVETPKFVTGLSLLSRFAPCFALYSLPPELTARYPSGDLARTVKLVSSAYLYDDLAGWLPMLFASLTILQPIEAQIRAEMAATMLGGRPDTSTPPGAEDLLPLDGMLNVVGDLYGPAGDGESRWADGVEFAAIAETYGRSDICFGNGGPEGLTLETPFGEDSALIQLHSGGRHPSLGCGLLATLKIPYYPGEAESAEAARWYTSLEVVTSTGVPLLGGWCVETSRAPGPAFSTFIPNYLHGPGPGVATNVALWMLKRARWLRATVFPHLQDIPMSEIMRRREEA